MTGSNGHNSARSRCPVMGHREASTVDVRQLHALQPLFDAASDYLHLGWSVIPAAGKTPAVPWKRWQEQRPSETELSEMFSEAAERVTGIGVVLGEVSGGLFVRDFDDEASYHRFCDDHPELAAALPTARTRRGFHVYATSSRPVSTVSLGDGELRGEHSFVVLPPSRHPSGVDYRWLSEPDGPVPAVDVELLKTSAAPGSLTQTKTDDNGRPQKMAICPRPSSSVSLSAEVLDAISASLPGAPGERNRKIFELCRRLRAIPGVAGRDEGAFREVVREWYRRAEARIGTKDFDETWADFVHGWSRVKVPLRADRSLDDIVNLSELRTPPGAERCSKETRTLLAVCQQLQFKAGAKPFFLTVRHAGRLSGLDHKTAHRRLRALEVDGWLECVQRGNAARATRYRFTNPTGLD